MRKICDRLSTNIMTQNLNCKQITSALKAIRSKRIEFDTARKENKIAESLKLMKELRLLIKEIELKDWPLEILTRENLNKQHNSWRELYQELGEEYKLPDKRRISEFLKNDPEFMELMKTKEKQGFTRLIIAPAPGFYSLKDFADKIGDKIEENGGSKNHYSRMWKNMFDNEDDIHYFSTTVFDSFMINLNKTTTGVAAREIKNDPEKYSVYDGWMISFTTEGQNIPSSTEPDLDTGNGRLAIKTGLSVRTYIDKYFSDNNETYKGEECMIPQEHFALFAKDLLENYIKPNKKVTRNSVDLLSSTQVNIFASTSMPDDDYRPTAL